MISKLTRRGAWFVFPFQTICCKGEIKMVNIGKAQKSSVISHRCSMSRTIICVCIIILVSHQQFQGLLTWSGAPQCTVSLSFVWLVSMICRVQRALDEDQTERKIRKLNPFQDAQMLCAMHFPFTSPLGTSQFWTLSIWNSFQPIIFPHKGCKIVSVLWVGIVSNFSLTDGCTVKESASLKSGNDAIYFVTLRQISGRDPFLLQGRFLDEQVVLIFPFLENDLFFFFIVANRTLCHFFSNNIYNI